eukprot:6956227-Prymnesium_polylepis.1
MPVPVTSAPDRGSQHRPLLRFLYAAHAAACDRRSLEPLIAIHARLERGACRKRATKQSAV